MVEATGDIGDSSKRVAVEDGDGLGAVARGDTTSTKVAMVTVQG